MPGPPDFSIADLSGDWTDVRASDDGLLLADELAREMPQGHRLNGTEALAVAQHRRRKEVIYWLPIERRWAVVHLTWAIEAQPDLPTTVVCPTWQAVLDELDDRGRR